MSIHALYIRLAQSVEKMRQHQKDYFKTRTPSSLKASKESEREVDKLLKEIEKEDRQPNLF